MSEIAVFGANGTIGSRIMNEALSRGHTVTAGVLCSARAGGVRLSPHIYKTSVEIETAVAVIADHTVTGATTSRLAEGQ